MHKNYNVSPPIYRLTFYILYPIIYEYDIFTLPYIRTEILICNSGNSRLICISG